MPKCPIDRIMHFLITRVGNDAICVFHGNNQWSYIAPPIEQKLIEFAFLFLCPLFTQSHLLLSNVCSALIEAKQLEKSETSDVIQSTNRQE